MRMSDRLRKPYCKLLVASLLYAGLMSPAVAASIYKTVDKDGNVVYTDVPPKNTGTQQNGDRSIEIDVSNSNTYVAPKPPQRSRTQDTLVGNEGSTETTYSRLEIVYPSDDEAIRNNAGNINFSVATTPDLHSGHQFEVLLDGKPLADKGETNSGSGLALTNVDRGTHVASVQIVDANGTVIIASKPVTFHLLRANLNTRRNLGAP